jgi:hypothetical protein
MLSWRLVRVQPPLQPLLPLPKKLLLIQDLPSEFRSCRLMDPHPPVYGEKALNLKEATGRGFDKMHKNIFRYQCAGPIYDQYLQQHQFPFVLQKHQLDPHWGTRPTIVPFSEKKLNRHILVIGNSHTRQMIGSMLCQYHYHITSAQVLTPMPFQGHAVRYQLVGGLTLTVIINHPLVYSPRWEKNLEEYYLPEGTKLDDLDMIIMGMFNHYRAAFSTSSLWTDIINYGKHFPEQQVNPSLYHAPQLKQFARAYKGPILWVSMLAAYNEKHHERMMKQMHDIQKQQKRTNLRSVHARQHVEAIGAECSKSSSLQDDGIVGTCATNTSHFEYANGHRCVGDKGGQPDLVAWDVIEAIYDVLRQEEAQGKHN